MIGGTSGSEAKRCQPSASQSKITQTRSASLGSRKTTAPWDPCCLRLSAPFVEKMDVKRSKSSTCVVARSIAPPRALAAGPQREYLARPPARHRANALCRVDEVVLEGPERGGGPAAHPGLLVDVLDVVPDGLDGDAQAVADRLVRAAAHEGEQHLELARRQTGGQLARSLRDACPARRHARR